MSLPFGILGLLSYKESSGYELKKIFEDSLNNFWHAQASQIYRELERLEQKGLVECRVVLQEKRPNKRVYMITDQGREVLRVWLNSSMEEMQNVHEPLLMRVFFGGDAPDITLTLLKSYRDMCIEHTVDLSQAAQSVIDRYSAEMPDGGYKSIYWEMTLDYGIAKAHMAAEWAQRCIDKIEGSNKNECTFNF